MSLLIKNDPVTGWDRIEGDLSNPGGIPVSGKVSRAFAVFTRPGDNNNYSANDVISNSTSATVPLPIAVAQAADHGGYLVGCRVSTSKKSITPRLRVHIYQTDAITVAVDNAQMKAAYADETKKIGAWDLAAMITPADTANSDTSYQSDFSQRIPFVPKSGTSNVYVVLETLDAITTPDNAQSFTVTFWVDQN